MMNKSEDLQYLAHALELAEKGKFSVYPNPKVGAILVKNGKIISQGFHKSPGTPHAEWIAIKEAGKRSEGSTLYVNLEPCFHHGKTPPCVDLIIKSKIKRVVMCNFDPNPLVNKKSISKLRKNGIKVTTGIYKNVAVALNREFYHYHQNNRPFITVKLGISLDGKISLNNGKSKWITSEESRKDVQIERALSSLILTTANTIRADNSVLNVRDSVILNKISKQPDIGIIDNKSQLSEKYKIFSILNRRIYMYSKTKNTNKFPENVEVIDNLGSDNNVDRILKDLYKKGYYKIFVESGSGLVSSLFKYKLIDELLLYISPKILGNNSVPFSGLNGIKKLSQKINLKVNDIMPINNDLKVRLGK